LGSISAVQIKKDLVHELKKKDIGGTEKTWERGTTNMVDDNGKVLPIDREMPNNPTRSRKEWNETREESREISTKQRA